MLVSQWKVNSASTSLLMTDFYMDLESQQRGTKTGIATSTQKAQLTLLKTERYHHPFYWAAFVAMGRE